MTKSLRCRDVERLLLEREDGAFAAGEERLVEEHLRACAGCRGFTADRALIRGELTGVRWPEPPAELVSRTRRMLRRRGPERATAVPPAWVLISLAAVTIITALWLAVSLADVTPDMTLADLPLAALGAVLIIVQNAVMLFCAPVVLRAFRMRRSGPESIR